MRCLYWHGCQPQPQYVCTVHTHTHKHTFASRLNHLIKCGFQSFCFDWSFLFLWHCVGARCNWFSPNKSFWSTKKPGEYFSDCQFISSDWQWQWKKWHLSQQKKYIAQWTIIRAQKIKLMGNYICYTFFYIKTIYSWYVPSMWFIVFTVHVRSTRIPINYVCHCILWTMHTQCTLSEYKKLN